MTNADIDRLNERLTRARDRAKIAMALPGSPKNDARLAAACKQMRIIRRQIQDARDKSGKWPEPFVVPADCIGNAC